jgi:hypothetical protein
MIYFLCNIIALFSNDDDIAQFFQLDHVPDDSRRHVRGDRRLLGRLHRGHAGHAAVLQKLLEPVNLRNEVSTIFLTFDEARQRFMLTVSFSLFRNN